MRRYFARRREENRLAWCDYHRRLQVLHQGLADEHAEKLEKLESQNVRHHEETA